MRLCPLFSGSSGNCIYIEFSENYGILVDVGKSNKQLESAFKVNNINPSNIKAIFITHEHSDHISDLCSLANHTESKYYISEKSFFSITPRIFRDVKGLKHEFISPFDELMINNMKIPFIPLSHDSRECLGLIIEEDGKKVVYISDTGYVNEEYRDILVGANCYLFEANHDPLMEMASNRPQYLKNRVLGDIGHLSNEDSAVALSYLMTDKTTNVIFIHRSHDCNSLDALKETVFKVFETYSLDLSNISFDYAEQDSPTRVIEV